jgi:uncharacterized protein DUF1592/uncharacterized protein DUF1588/uncharacterized protein DUF1595/uncharacterized protein DUF1585/uncharacterized protein DUF1587
LRTSRAIWAFGSASLMLAAFLVGSSSTSVTAATTVATEPATMGGPPTLRRLNEEQYKRSIRDIFGAAINVPGRFDPPLRDHGLLAIGDGKVAVSSSGLEQYELRAREIAAQVLAADKRKTFLSCAPQAANAFDKACATAFFRHYGRLLYRRPLTEAEMASTNMVANASTAKSGDFYKGLEVGLSRLLSSPNFIFRVERSEPDPGAPGSSRLDAYSLATRMSFLLWDAPPDVELLDAARSGALRSQEVVEKQVDRLIASPRFADGVRAFFSDMFAYEQFDGLSKDQTIYPKFTSQMAKDAEEQTLRTIVDILVTHNGDYRDLFTTKKTFLNRNLAALYEVPVTGLGPDGWRPYTFAPDDARAGILTFAAFLMLDPSHEGRSSPTIRGKTVRELLLCQKVPPPPGNVDQSLVQNTSNQVLKTARERLTVHQENPVCAGCHRVTDPIGLAMENYDAVGAFRTRENGALINASGTFEDKTYKDAVTLQQALHDSPTGPSCVVQRAYEYGVGRQATASEEKWLEFAGQSFAADHYSFPALVRRIATSKALRAVSPAKMASAH